MNSLETHHIHFNGIVQGVGFRPLVYRLATAMGLKGYVKNGNDGVDIVFNANADDADWLFTQIKKESPAKAKIISAVLKKTKEASFDEFTISIDKEENGPKQVLLTPDIALCDNCRNELHDHENRRYRYPFITCTQCGPRYSIINALPYDRHSTAMGKFVMCTPCSAEYHDVAGSRFFSQTNSCNTCGIKLRLHSNASTVWWGDAEKILLHLHTFLSRGKIIAVKGVGGYLLLCDANNKQAIQLLRSRKQRATKPFAVLYRDMDTIADHFELAAAERKLLQSPEAPIVLLQPKWTAYKEISVNNIAPHLNRVGVMLPYSPLLDLIANDFERPLIATSANISGSPIIYRDEDALDNLFEVADYIISYNRDIVIPQDDSVVQVSKYARQSIILRRSRGYAPCVMAYQPKNNEAVLAMGALLKSSFTLALNGNVFTSQFLGSGESYESQLMYRNTLTHWLQMYAVKPGVIIADKHPGYFSHQYAVELAAPDAIEIKFVQHHEAHFAAILAESDLLQTDEPVLGVVWDGTGLGTDGNIWGGEFFKFDNNQIQRIAHFDYFPTIAGDKMALEPRIAALCVTDGVWPPPGHLREKFTQTEWNNYQILIDNSGIFSSSVGRMFDAVASLLLLADKQSYEGEAAMYLQVLAEEYVDINGFEMDESYLYTAEEEAVLSTRLLIQGVMIDIEKNRPANYIAARFHYSLVCGIDAVAQKAGLTKICFSGGVFQNSFLVDCIQHFCGNKYQLYFHQNLSPNDENISFGQMVYYDNKLTSLPQSTKINEPQHCNV